MVKIKEIEQALKKVMDPHTGISVFEMGLIRKIDIEKDGSVKILFVPTTPFCPMTQYLMEHIKKAAESAGAKKVEVEMGQ
jgi:metal-sulfur cluster biosynthetic enzyme